MSARKVHTSKQHGKIGKTAGAAAQIVGRRFDVQHVDGHHGRRAPAADARSTAAGTDADNCAATFVLYKCAALMVVVGWGGWSVGRWWSASALGGVKLLPSVCTSASGSSFVGTAAATAARVVVILAPACRTTPPTAYKGGAATGGAHPCEPIRSHPPSPPRPAPAHAAARRRCNPVAPRPLVARGATKPPPTTPGGCFNPRGWFFGLRYFTCVQIGSDFWVLVESI